MRSSRLLATLSVLTLLLCGSIALGQTVPATAVPFITQVSPPSLPPTATAPGYGNFTLTILGANFQANLVVNLSIPGGTPVHPSSTTVNAGGSQIVAQFTNSILPTPATLLVTVTNPTGTPPSTSNAYYLPETPTQTSVALNQNTTPFLPGTPVGIVVANLRGSGLPDFAVVSQNTNTVTVEWSDFNGPFLAGGTYATGNNPSGIAAVDFFGNGQLGLAVVNSGDNAITILLPNGDGTFRPGNTISLPGVYPTQLVAADFNGDGKIDLAVLNTCGSGPAVSCFPAPAQFPGSVTILLGNGDGTFSISPTQPTTGHNPGAIASADLNGDGILDLIVMNDPDFNLTLLMGNGDGTFTPTTVSPLTGNYPRALVIGDFNGDGYPDIAVADSTDSAVAILLNQKCPLLPLQQCTLAAPVSFSTGAYPLAIATADMNADGFLDLVVVNGDSYSVSVLLGDGKGGFTAAVPQSGPNFSTGTLPAGVVLGDFNQDGRLDIVTMNTSGSYSYLRQAAVAQVVLTTDLANPIYGQVPNLTATLNPSPGSAAPTGTVVFYDGSTPIGTVPLNGYQAVLQYSGLSTGTHQVTAVYGGDTNFVSVTSNAVAETVSTAQTTTTLNSNVANVPYGLPITLTAAVQPQAGGGTVTGSISFIDTTKSTDVGDVALVNNTAQLTLSNLPAGTHVLIANYPGDTNLNPSASPTVTVTVTQASSTTTLTSNTNPSTFNNQLTLSATVQPSPSSTATGTVSFYDGPSLLGSGTLANNVALFQTYALVGGSRSITARYSGDANITGSTSSIYIQTVNPAPTTIIILPSSNPSIYGQTVTYSTSVRSAIVGQVNEGQLSIYDGSTLFSTVNLATNSTVYYVNYLKAGTHSITAQYSGTSNYAASTSTPLTQTVNQDTTTTNVAALPNPSSVGQTVNITVSVDPAHYYSSSGGTITLFDNGTSIGSATLAMVGGAFFTFTWQTPGTHTLTASYAGDSNLLASSSASFTQTVNPAATTNSVSLSSNTATYGQSVTVTSTVHPTFSGSPTGTVTFLDGSTTLGTVTLTSGSAQFTTSSLSVASHSIIAKYNGDSNFSTSTSSPQTLTVNPAPTTTTESVDLNPATYGQTVTLSAMIQLSSGSGATGSISFFDGSTSLGTVALSNGSAQLPVSSLTAGSHSITAKYSGDTTFAASTSTALPETVNPAGTSTSVSSSANPAIVGQSVAFIATVQPPAGTSATGTINFLDGSLSLGTATLSSNSAKLVVTTILAGSHSITAVYSGSANLSASNSATLSETINTAPTSIAFTTSANPSSFGQAVRFVATVQPTTGGTVTGTVTFWDGTTSLATAQVVNNPSQYNQATLLNGSFQGGSHSITASYSGDANFSASTSAVTTVTVNPASSTVSLSASQNPASFGQTIALMAAVQPSLSGDLASGSVTFFDGANALGTANLSNNLAQLSISNLSTGAHSLTVKYNGDNNFAASTSSALAETINVSATTITVAGNINPSFYGQSVNFVAIVQPSAGGSPAGAVTFFDGGNSLGSAPVSVNIAQLALSNFTVGSHSIAAAYSGDGNFSASTSAAATQTVKQSYTMTSVSSNLSSSALGQPVTFTASIRPPFGGIPTGTVTFSDGSFSIGSANLSGTSAQLTLTSLSRGSHSISAQYNGDSNFTSSSSSTIAQTVTQAATSASLSSSANPSAYGQSVTFTASVTPAFAGAPTGTTTFFDGSTSLGSATLSAGSAQISISTLSAASHSITAVYNGDANFTSSTSSATVETVNASSTATTVASSANPSSFDQTVTFTAAIQSSAGTTATGSVSFFDGSTSLGSATLSSNSAQLTVFALAVGTHSVTAAYAGNANLSGSTSAAISQVVNGATTTTTVTSNSNPSNFGQSVTLTAAIQPAFGGGATGTATFFDGSTSLGTSTVFDNAAQLSLSTLSAGAHSITAKYNGDANFSASTSTAVTQTVNLGPTSATVASNLNPSAFGQSVTFTASVQSSVGGTPTGTVAFFDGGLSLGSANLSSGSAQLTLASLSPGSHSITAKYNGDSSFAASTSAALTQTLSQAGSSTTLTSSANPSAFGQAITFTAAIQTVYGGTATGTVTFLDGTASLGTVSVSGNAAQISLSGLALGSHSITAKYSGNSNFTASTSAAVTQSVTQAATATSVNSNADPSSYGQSVTFTATVAPAYAGTPTGTVTFSDGSNSLGSATLSGGIASLTTGATSLLSGAHSISAKYNGDSNFLASTSANLAQTVNPIATATTLVSSANPSAAGKSVTFTASVSSSVGGTLSGTVNFYLDRGTTAVSSSSLSNGSAQYSTNSLTAGTHSLTAVFVPSNSNFGGSTSAPLTQSTTDFSISASPASNTISRGTSGTYTLTVTPLGGLTGSVSLSCAGLPGGTTCAISPSSVTLDATNPAKATVTITVAHNGSTGTHTFTLKGTSGSFTHSTTVTLMIK